MKAVELVCPCGGTLEVGFLRDKMEGGVAPGAWVEGPPKSSFWTGTVTSGRDQIEIQAYRCRKCGRIELYARESAE